MELIERIDAFAVDIYFDMAQEIQVKYVDIIVEFSEYIERNFRDQLELLQMKNQLIARLEELMRKRDFIMMAEALKYEVKPILLEIRMSAT